MRARRPLAAVMLGAAVLAVGCGSTSPAQPVGEAVQTAASGPVTISFADYNLATAGLGADGTNRLIQDFEKANPHIKINPVGITATEILPKVQAMVVAGDPPDVAQEGFGDLEFVVKDLQAKPLAPIAGAQALQTTLSAMYKPVSQLGVYGGQVYGLPFTLSTSILFYNASLFRKAGLDPSQPPATWSEVKQDALALKAKTGAAGAYIDCAYYFDWCWQGMVLSNGGRVLSSDRKTLMFGDGPAVQAAAMWQDLVKSGAHPPLNENDAIAAFEAGKMGMLLETSALQASFLSAAAKGGWDLQAAPMPAFAGHAVVPTNSGSALFILSDNPQKQQAAWRFLQFMTSEQAYTIITEQIGYLPLRPDAVSNPSYLKGWIGQHPLMQPNLRQLQRLQPWVSFPGPNYVQIKNIMLTALQQVVFNGADPAGTLGAAQQRAQALMP
jgi:multiple sugar transport system substrate-binding protein